MAFNLILSKQINIVFFVEIWKSINNNKKNKKYENEAVALNDKN